MDIDIADLLEKVNIVAYIAQFCEMEEKDGEYWMLSPFTSEVTPSFSVNEEKQIYYDFSSGHGGNILTFIQKYHKVSFSKALDILVKYANYNPTSHTGNSLNIIKTFKKFNYKSHLVDAEHHVVLPHDIMMQYEFDVEKLDIWKREGISLSVMQKFEVKYDRLNNRLVFPIKNECGEIISLSGRTLEPDWKQCGIRKYTYLYKLGKCDVIYGLYENSTYIKDKNEIIIFEGAKSVMLAGTLGIHNVGAALTSHLNPSQMQILLKLGVKVVFAFDSEIDVRKDEQIGKLSRFLPIEYIWNYNGLLAEKDAPIDKGYDVFKELYEHRRRWD